MGVIERWNLFRLGCESFRCSRDSGRCMRAGETSPVTSSVAVRGTLLAFVAGIAAVTTMVAWPSQTVAQNKVQAPGYYHMALGDLEITALYDGYVNIDRNLLTGANAQEIQSLLARMFLAKTDGMQTAVNAYIVQTGGRLVLIDAGGAKTLGPTLGAILDNIRAAGYEPAQIDTVLLTHLHPDHAGGLLTPDGKAAFPNAEVRVSKTEADFWLSEAVAVQAPEDFQPFFKMARDAVAPYIAAGKFKIYDSGEMLLPGVVVVPAPGHTPGHTGYLFSSDDHSLLVWGDVVHSYATQFARPEIAIEFDTNKAQAVATRKRIFAEAAEQQLWVAGAHLPFPGIGHVRAESDGYAWVPIEYGPLPVKH